MKWKIPPDIKIYEALGCLADGRLREESGEVRVYSSSGNKYYTVLYDQSSNSIMTNDNGSYWQGYLGYTAISYLMSIGKIKFNKIHSSLLKDIHWKDINTQNKNDFEKTKQNVHEIIIERGGELDAFEADIINIMRQIEDLSMNKLGKRIKPPSGY